jgi:hypothetical protein
MLVRAVNIDTAGATASFSDVPATSWFYDAVAAGVEAGIVQGTGNNKFDPNKPITREEMAIMAARALKLSKSITVANPDAVLGKFKDQGSMAAYAKESIALLTQEGIINGMTASTFAPKGDASRAQAAVIIFKMLSLLEA